MNDQARWKWIVVALGVWLAAWGFTKWRGNEPSERPDWQRPASELTNAQQEHFIAIRTAILSAEATRNLGAWPADFMTGFSMRQQGLFVNYVGEAEGLRWLVVFMEPDPRQPPEDAAQDDQHHLLADGRMLHVTVWTQPLTEAKSQNVIAWPAAEGWVERVR